MTLPYYYSFAFVLYHVVLQITFVSAFLVPSLYSLPLLLFFPSLSLSLFRPLSILRLVLPIGCQVVFQLDWLWLYVLRISPVNPRTLYSDLLPYIRTALRVIESGASSCRTFVTTSLFYIELLSLSLRSSIPGEIGLFSFWGGVERWRGMKRMP